MNSEVDYGGPGSSGNGKLRQWLIEQVDCGKYPGLVWENEEKTIFRIPWKHAGKQDYNREEDAALFKAWALFKGKYREGVDKPDPPTWKTRLRCALNKSNDFEELVDRSQLDISDPFKVYHIIPEGAKKRTREEDSPMNYLMNSAYPTLQTQIPQYVPSPECGWRDFSQEYAPLPEIPFTPCPCPPRSLPWQGASVDNGYQLRASIYSYGSADSQPSPFSLDTSIRSAEALRDPRLHITVYLRDTLVKEVTTFSPEGCHITPASPENTHYLSPGGHDVVPLPMETISAQMSGEERPASPSSSFEGGVLCWMAADGLYARRLCEGRVYWQAGLTPYGEKPKKLDREVACKLLHMQDYLAEIQSYSLHGRPLTTHFQVLLSFGDECLEPQRASLNVQVEPLFARQLLYYAQQTSGHFYRSYEHSGLMEHTSLSEDYHRALTQHHGLQK
ncbi:interferon regulatory factor 4-like [Corythoichthys intestinalis]|uniref:interferon regulatory factor 4-like n=1 Tax=Corythoichthys intestinalis TaxID=161448 RepID=UPI0025A64A6F|nr:interferon regulatory factor 4-like [Corythoichthys intestinalis]XP_061790922.1 interferon regulatory factor 4-like [Nerophis lumbriciformis]